ncbi:MAG: hypothetical protein ACRDI0_12900 [Actinomycetota bacterium]
MLATRLRLILLLAGLVLVATTTGAVASTVDVSLTVERPAGSPPTLAFTGFPILLLVALLAILVVGGALMIHRRQGAGGNGDRKGELRCARAWQPPAACS